MVERARWLAELTEAIAEAQRLAWRLGVLEGDSEDARELYARLEGLASEVQSLRFGGWLNVRQEADLPTLEGLLPDNRWRGVTTRNYTPAGKSPPPENGSRKGRNRGGFHPDVATKARLRNAGLPYPSGAPSGPSTRPPAASKTA